MVTVRLQSDRGGEVMEKGEAQRWMPMGVHTPGLIRWAKVKFDPRKPKVAYALASAFGVKREVMVALLTGEVDFTVEGDEVVFQWPGDPNAKEGE